MDGGEIKKENIIVELTFQFALDAIVYCELLEGEKKFVIARQLLRCATSIGANVHESQSAESKADFIHKLKIAHKELEETDYWLRLCLKSTGYPNPDILMPQVLPIKKVLSKIIASSKTK